MNYYKNMIVLVDDACYETNAIIGTNEELETIKNAIQEAKKIWWSDDGCETYLVNFVGDYLKEKFGDILFSTDLETVYY